MDRAVNAESMAATGAPLAVQQGLGMLWEHQGFEVEPDRLGRGRYCRRFCQLDTISLGESQVLYVQLFVELRDPCQAAKESSGSRI